MALRDNRDGENRPNPLNQRIDRSIHERGRAEWRGWRGGPGSESIGLEDQLPFGSHTAKAIEARAPLNTKGRG